LLIENLTRFVISGEVSISTPVFDFRDFRKLETVFCFLLILVDVPEDFSASLHAAVERDKYNGGITR